jgi:hypothetical protein
MMLRMSRITDIRNLLAVRGFTPVNRAAACASTPRPQPTFPDQRRQIGRTMMVAVSRRLRASALMAADGECRDLIADIAESDATISDCIAGIRNLSRNVR